MKKVILLGLCVGLIAFTGCKEDEDPIVTTPTPDSFTVTIENVFTGKDYFSAGGTGLIMPGSSESFSFQAGKGHYLQFATMFAQSNDLFYAPGDEGIALYDNAGSPLTGDITSMISFWDGGTEVNEEPGVGANQAPRQAGANTGDDENGNVQLLSAVNDGFMYPSVADVIEVTIAHDGGTMFTVTLNNVSGSASVPSPLAPGAWVVHSAGQKPLFTSGSAASTALERMAEDGDNAMLESSVVDNSGLVSPFAPGAYNVGSTNEIFTIGQTASEALEDLAEDGSPAGYANAFNTPEGASAPAPIFPGESYSFTFTAESGNLSFATMLVQSNDWFIGADNIDLFPNGNALSQDITSMLKLYDAGTEVDEYAGAGNDQAPRQAGPDTGADEGGMVEVETSPSSNLPAIADYIKVTVTKN